jgi:PleD family two-component response regulator
VEQHFEDAAELFPQEFSFMQAKLDHYLRQCEEYIVAHRLLMARSVLAKVFAVDPDNQAASSLEKRVDYTLHVLSLLERGIGRTGTDKNQVSHRHRRGRIVLIVDQDERVLGSLADKFAIHGFDAVCAGGYQEALDTIALVKPDVVISEVNFEKGSLGLDLFLLVRTNAATAEIPFIFLAARVDRDMLIAGKKVGVDDFILKPLDADVVVASAVQCLSRRHPAALER